MPNYVVLFVSRTNTGRTLMAELLVARWGASRLRALSAGLAPGVGPDPGAALALREELYASTGAPKLLSEVLKTLDRTIDLVIALDPVDLDLAILGNPPVFFWRVDDPRSYPGGEKDRHRAWRSVLRDLEARIKRLAAVLPQQGVEDLLVRQRTEDARSRVDGVASSGM
jgi:protein-tyrosine-phosphatase